MRALVERFGVPLCPESEVDQGDPFLLEAPAGTPGHRFYVYVSGPGFPVYGSDDLTGWRRLGDSRPDGGDAWSWAPCVRYVAGLHRPWVMLYSQARGAGEVDGHRGHRILRADSDRPEGPFVDSGEVLTPELDFAIDPDVSPDPAGGGPLLTFAADYVSDQPYGTGLFEAAVRPDLRGLTSPPRPVARPRSEWQLYDGARSMPWKDIPGVSWAAGETVRWYTMEGPAAVLSPGGRRTLLYSGGNFAGFYGVGVLQADRSGRWVDLSPTPQDCLLAPMPERGVYGPGHCSVLATDAAPDRQVLCFHFRTAPGAPRQFGILPLSWAGDRPYCAVPGATADPATVRTT
ncbi:MAG TPA: family 43 glycosylhydrolase [Mycobacteriales bacterium]